MAKTESLIRGRCGNMIFYRRKGVTCIRQAPMEFHDADTPAQQASRKRFIAALRFYQRMKASPLTDCWRIAAEGTTLSGYNLFMKLNIFAFNERTIGDPEQLLLALGTLPRMQCLRVAAVEEQRVRLVWENSLEVEDGHENDRLQVVALFEGRMYTPVWLGDPAACRSRKEATVDLGRLCHRPVHLYCFFVTPDRKAWSSSTYVRVTPNAGV